MNLKEFSTEIVLSLILLTYKLYAKIASTVLWIFFPKIKPIVSKRMRNIQVHNDRVYIKAILEGDLGIYESYMDGDWTSKDLVGAISKALLTRRIRSNLHPLTWTLEYFNLQTRKRAWQVGEEHYDIGNDIYHSMLDKNMQYTCGYWKDAKNLDEAQVAKMELIAQKLKLKPGMKVLDIGCGFGTLAHYLAKQHGVTVVGCSISKEQTKYGESLCTELPVEFRLCDYRELNEQTFDRIVSVGMFEHVGIHNYKEFFQVVHRCLKDDGIFLLHTIGINHKTMPNASMFIHKYIFPNGYVPYPKDICKSSEDLWVIEDWHNFGLDYSKTLAAWESNFDKAWPELSMKYGERFYRMWKLYLSLSQAVFLTRSFQLWQIVLSKDGLKDGYCAPR